MFPLAALKLVNPRIWMGLGLAVAIGLGSIWVHHKGYVRGVTKTTAELQPVIDGLQAEKALAEAEAIKADALYRAKERNWAQQLRDAQEEYVQVQKDTAIRLASALKRADAGVATANRLRSDIARYAAASGSPTDDTVTAARARAEALGVLLAEALRVDAEALRTSAESAEGAESAGNAVRALMAAWPK